MDYIEPIPFLIIMALIVLAWLTIGILDRRTWRREADAWHVALNRIQREEARGRCGRAWWISEAHDYAVCTRHFEHVGPCLDTLTGRIDR